MMATEMNTGKFEASVDHLRDCTLPDENIENPLAQEHSIFREY